MPDGFKGLFNGKHSFTWYATKNYFKSPIDFSVSLELAKESVGVGSGFTEAIEQIQISIIAGLISTYINLLIIGIWFSFWCQQQENLC